MFENSSETFSFAEFRVIIKNQTRNIQANFRKLFAIVTFNYSDYLEFSFHRH